MYDFKNKGYATDFKKSEHVPEFKVFILIPAKKKRY